MFPCPCSGVRDSLYYATTSDNTVCKSFFTVPLVTEFNGALSTILLTRLWNQVLIESIEFLYHVPFKRCFELKCKFKLRF